MLYLPRRQEKGLVMFLKKKTQKNNHEPRTREHGKAQLNINLFTIKLFNSLRLTNFL